MLIIFFVITLFVSFIFSLRKDIPIYPCNSNAISVLSKQLNFHLHNYQCKVKHFELFLFIFQVVDHAVKIYKGTNPEVDSYSAFWDNSKLTDTKLAAQLRMRNITDVYVCGVAYDVCVGRYEKTCIRFRRRKLKVPYKYIKFLFEVKPKTFIRSESQFSNSLMFFNTKVITKITNIFFCYVVQYLIIRYKHFSIELRYLSTVVGGLYRTLKPSKNFRGESRFIFISCSPFLYGIMKVITVNSANFNFNHSSIPFYILISCFAQFTKQKNVQNITVSRNHQFWLRRLCS